MKPRLISRLVLLSLAAKTAHAAGTTTTWTNLAGGSWGTPTNWSAAPTFAADDILDFSTLDIAADRTTTLDGNRTAGALKFGDDTIASNNWIVNTGTSGTLTLDVTTGTPTIEVVNRTTTIGAAIAGNDGLKKTGAGTLSLTNAANNYSGGTTVSEGMLSAGNANTTNYLGTGAVTVENDATLNLNSSRATYSAITLNGIGASGMSGALVLGGGASFSSITVTNLTLGSDATIGTANASGNGNGIAGSVALGAHTLTCNPLTPASSPASESLGISAAISGTGSILQNGPGQTTLSGTNAYTGTTTAWAGALIATKPAALPGYNAAGKVFIDGGTIAARVGGSDWTTAQVDTLLVNATKTFGALGIDTNNANLSQWTAFTTSNLGPNLGLNKLGNNTLTLNQANTYTGNTIVTTGTLLATNAAALPGYDVPGQVVFFGGTLGLQVGGAGWTTSEVDAVLANATKTRGALGIDTTNGNLTQWTAFTNTNLSSTVGLSKLGNNILTLDQANTYTGVTTVSAGTLRIAKVASLYNGNATSWTPANIDVKSGATLALNVGGTDQFDTATVNTLLTNISVAANANSGLQSGAAIAFDTTNATGGSYTQGNAIANSTGTSGGAIGLTKLGTGTLVLDKTNTYTGVTTIGGGNSGNAGTLTVNGDNSAANGGWSINGASTVNFNSSIVLAAGKTITFGNGGSDNNRILNVAAAVTASATSTTWVTGGNTINLNPGANWTQNGDFRIQPNTTFTDAVVNVNSGASFTYAGGTKIILTNSPGTNSGDGFLKINGGTFTTGQGFDNNSTGTAGTGNLVLSNGGTLKLSAAITDLVVGTSTQPFNVQLGTGGGIVDTNSFSTTLNVGITGSGGLTKAGAGTLTTTGINSYAGDTVVSGGILSVAGPDFDDASSVSIAPGAKLNLNFAGTDVIHALSINGGAPLADGVYSSATHPAFITGSGTLTVSNSGSTPGFGSWATGLGLSGNPDADFDKDGIADATEYVLGTNPKASSSSGITAQKSGGNLIFTFSRSDDSETPDIALTVQAGTTLGAWPQVFTIGADTASSTAGVVVTENGSASDTVTVTIPTSGAAKLFAQLKVAVAP